MLITKVKRSYSRSISAKSFNLPDSWIKIESEYEATVESGDDPVKVSEMLYDQAKSEVVTAVAEVTAKMKEAALNLQNTASGNSNVPPTEPRPLG